MESHTIFPLLTLAFGLGLVHALDADHVMVISNLIGKRTSLKQSLSYASRWALGHGATLLIIGIFVFVLGQAIPKQFSTFAEHGVGALLILLGAWVLWDLRHKKAHLHFHQHDDLPEHAHWHQHRHHNKQRHRLNSHTHNHGAMMIGVLHGAAGSAPLLALIPITQFTSPWIGVAYLLVFAIGVLLSMLVFGGVFSGIVKGLQRFGDRAIKLLRVSVAGGSIVFGIHLLIGSTA